MPARTQRNIKKPVHDCDLLCVALLESRAGIGNNKNNTSIKTAITKNEKSGKGKRIAMRFLKLVALIVMIAALTGCASCKQTAEVESLQADTPFNDPGDHVLTQAVTEFLQQTESPVSSRYEFSRLDLDDDGRRDALVMFKNPYGYWCGTHGCTLLVMKANNNSFTLVNSIQPVRAPLHVSELRTNGWRNLITRVSGRQEKAKDVALQFNGRDYPQNPATLPPYLVLAENEHSVTIFP